MSLNVPDGFSITVWNDYVCPWAYLGRRHTHWLIEQGVPIEVRAYELHPDLPPTGRPIEAGGRYDRLLDDLGMQAREAGQPFAKPVRTPSSRRALEVLELLARHEPDRVFAFDEAAARAVWVDGRALDDHAVLDDIVAGVGVDPAALHDRLDAGEGAELVDLGRRHAIELEVSGTPAWRLGSLTVTGVHHDDQFRRWVTRIVERAADPDPP